MEFSNYQARRGRQINESTNTNGECLYAESHERLGIKEFRYCPGVQCRVVFTEGCSTAGNNEERLELFWRYLVRFLSSSSVRGSKNTLIGFLASFSDLQGEAEMEIAKYMEKVLQKGFRL